MARVAIKRAFVSLTSGDQHLDTKSLSLTSFDLAHVRVAVPSEEEANAMRSIIGELALIRVSVRCQQQSDTAHFTIVELPYNTFSSDHATKHKLMEPWKARILTDVRIAIARSEDTPTMPTTFCKLAHILIPKQQTKTS